MHSNIEMQQCAKECLKCYEICALTLQYCLEKAGKHVARAHLTLLSDCMEICRTSADFLLRGSEAHDAPSRACADICRRCAQDCRRFDADKAMEACAEACARCAEACDKMAAVPS